MIRSGMADSVSRGRKVKFQFAWPFRVSEFSRYPFGQRMYSPEFKTLHNDIGFHWRIFIQPNGGLCDGKDYQNHLGFYVEYLGKEELRSSIPVASHHFIEISHKLGEYTPGGLITQTTKKPIGKPEFLPKSVGDIRARGLISNRDFLKLGVVLEIPEDVFSWAQMMKEKEAGIRKDPKLDFSRLFEDIIMTEATEPPLKRGRFGDQHPPKDKQKVLDFQILSSDSGIIWCHKVVLGKKNEFFARLNASEMTEGEMSEMKVKYDSVTMKELIHFIYTDGISGKFKESDLHGLLDGAESYGLPGLKLICERRLIEQLDVENLAEYLEMADRYQLKILREVSINLASENINGVRKTEKGKELRDHIWDEVFDVGEKRSRVLKLPPTGICSCCGGMHD